MHIGLMQFVVQHIEFQVFMSNHFISFFSNNIFFGKLSSWVKLSVVDFPETAVKGVFKFLSLTIGRYEDNRSRQAVKNLVRELAKVHPTATLKNVSSALSSEAEAQRKRVHARYGKEYLKKRVFTVNLHYMNSVPLSNSFTVISLLFCSHNSSGNALFALTWTCIVLKEVWTMDKKCDRNDLKNLVCDSWWTFFNNFIYY